MAFVFFWLVFCGGIAGNGWVLVAVLDPVASAKISYEEARRLAGSGR